MDFKTTDYHGNLVRLPYNFGMNIKTGRLAHGIDAMVLRTGLLIKKGRCGNVR